MKHTLKLILWFSLALVLFAGLAVSASAGTTWYDAHPDWVATHSDPHFDITVRPNDPMTVEELIALTTARSYWATGDTSNTPAPRDKNGDLPSDWAAPYIRYYSSTARAFDPARVDYDAPATLGFMMRFFASVKGLYSFNAVNLYTFTGTEGYSAEEKLLLSVAVDYGLVPYTKDMNVSVANLLRKDLEDKYLIPTGEVKPKYGPVQTAASYQNSLVFFEDTYDYWTLGDRRTNKYRELENIKAMGDAVNIVNMNIQVLNQNGKNGSFLQEDRVPMSPVHAELMDYCKENGIKLLCGVLNYYDATALQAMKDDPGAVERAADELAACVDKYGFDGLDVDIEMFTNTYREQYSALLKALSSRMRERGKLLVSTVGAYFSDASEANSMYDYNVIRDTCDLVMIILYDDHSARNYNSNPSATHGCVSNYEYIRRCLTYTVTRLGAEKTLMSVASYGVDFNLDNHSAVAVTRQEIDALLKSTGAKPASHNQADDDTYFSYQDSEGRRHEVYYDSDEALARRLQYATQYSLAGVCTYYALCDAPALTEMIHSRLVDLPFKDVSRTWYYDSVRWAVQNAVTSGTSAGTFSPESICTRAQVVTFLWRAMGKPAPQTIANPFADVPENAYYRDAVLWAVEQGITNGTGTDAEGMPIFSPDTDCSYAHILTFLWRTLTGNSVSSYGTWYSEPLDWAGSLLTDTAPGADTARVTENCPRCDVVTYLWRALEKAE